MGASFAPNISSAAEGAKGKPALMRFLTVAAIGVAGDRFGVQRTNPAAVLLDPGRGIGCFHRQRLAIDRQLLAHLVSDNGDVIAELLYLGIVDFEIVQDPVA